jgi:hypothetical protein
VTAVANTTVAASSAGRRLPGCLPEGRLNDTVTPCRSELRCRQYALSRNLKQ